MLAGTSHALTYNSIEWKGAVSIPAGTFEYAVFPGNKFDDFLLENGITAPDPTLPNMLTYAYQLIDVPSNASVSFISVGDAQGHVANSHPPSWLNPGADTADVEQDPMTAADVGTSWAWSFGTTTASKITSGEVSSILYFQSIFAPEFDNVSASAPFGVQDSSVASISDMLIPQQFIPEPTAMCLALFAACGLLIWRRPRD
jgi:hypothetical protein